MTAAPFVGLPDDNPGTCAFAGVDLTGDRCAQQPTTHLRVMAPGWGDVALATCDGHEPLARAAGTVLDEHPWNRDTCSTAREPWPNGATP